jgi:hypothetical protein
MPGAGGAAIHAVAARSAAATVAHVSRAPAPVSPAGAPPSQRSSGLPSAVAREFAPG